MASDEIVLRTVGDGLFTASIDGVEVASAHVARAEGVWEFYSTRVDPAHQGRGIAATLVSFALEAAEEAGVLVIPSCWYVDRLMERRSPRHDHLRAGEAPVPGADERDPECRIGPVVLPAR